MQQEEHTLINLNHFLKLNLYSILGTSMSNPEFVIYTGPMFGGKTTRLLSEVERYRYKNRQVLAYKPSIDDRYDSESIVTHNGFKLKAKRIANALEILADLEQFCLPIADRPIVVVDEAFMIKGAGAILPNVFKDGYTILVSTLQLSASGKPFEEVEKLLPWATKVEICPAVCTKCDKDAFYTHRKISGLGEIAVGGEDMYEPRCLEHYNTIDS